ncbi:MAG TPA: Ku protein [Acidimicrobiia bacterium]
MPSAIWTGSISFGLVAVPVRLVTATKSRDVRFHQLEAGTGSRIRYRRVSDSTGDEVPNEKIVKGYELSAGQYVVVEADEMKALAPKASRMIEIEDFVDLAQIDPIYFEQPYYLVPDKSAAKPYRLLVDAMTELQKVAVGRLVMRSKETLVAIRPLDGVLCIETMRYADEVIPADQIEGVPDEKVEPTKKELLMARQLIEALSGDFEPDKYHDEYREELLALIDKKAAGEEIVAEPEPEEPAKVLDLMAALEASLARTGKGDAGGDTKAAKGARSSGGAKKAPAKKAVGAKKTRATNGKKPAAKKSTRGRRSA